ncbi:MAG: PQQ-binding-like beta-propeller repeat protein [Bacteroidetes bacterium]|nr:PQQ-binding-like beta-propeller repeat protein [Bacteroidota bacterium]
MKNPNRIFYFLLFSSFLSGCKPDDPIVSSEETFEINPNVEMIWSHEHGGQYSPAILSLLTEQYAVFVTLNDTTYSSKLLVIEKSTGDTQWCWDKELATIENVLFHDQKLYINSRGKGIICVDVNDGKTLWQWDDGVDLITNPVFFENKLYLAAHYGNSNRSCRITSLDPNSGNASIAYELIPSERGVNSNTLYSASYWRHPNGNLIAFYSSLVYPNNLPTPYSEFLAIDLTADTIFHNWGNYTKSSTPGSSVMVGDNVYFGGMTSATNEWKTGCINLASEKIKWDNRLSVTSPSYTEYFVVGNRVLMNSGNTVFINALDTGTGKLAWTNKSCGDNTGEYQHLNNIVWFKNGNGLFGLNPSTGAVKYHIHNYSLFEDLSKKQKLGWSVGEFSTFIIDEKTELFYAWTETHVMCFKIK